MKIKIWVLLLFILLPVLAAAQEDSSFVKMGIIKGSPASLTSMNYFFDQKNFAYADIYNTDKDTLYFIIDNSKPDSCIYILALTSNYHLAGYDYMKTQKIDSSVIQASGSLNSPDGIMYKEEVLYYPDSGEIFYKARKGSNFEFNIPALTYLAKKSSEINLKFEIGLRDEFSFMYAKFYNYQSSYVNATESAILPINFHLAVGFGFLDYYKIDFRAGIMYNYEDFYGTEKGVFLQANLFKTIFYAVAGFDNFSNGGEAHGVMVYSESGGNINFICLGGGLNVSKHFEPDAIYYFSLNKIYGYNYDTNTNQRYDKIVNGVLNLGFQYSFIL